MTNQLYCSYVCCLGLSKLVCNCLKNINLFEQMQQIQEVEKVEGLVVEGSQKMVISVSEES